MERSNALAPIVILFRYSLTQSGVLFGAAIAMGIAKTARHIAPTGLIILGVANVKTSILRR
jgi:hypothetical protein